MLSLTLMIYFQRRFFFIKKVTKGCRQTMAHTTCTHDTNWHRKAPSSLSSSAASSSTSPARSYSLYFGIARQRYVSCTGCQSADEWISRYPSLSIVRGWHRSCVPSWRMYAGYRRWPPSSVICWQSNVFGRQEITQPVRWSLFCHRRANAVEQSAWTAWQPDITWHHSTCVSSALETFVRMRYINLHLPLPLPSPSDNSNDCWKRSCLVSWAAVPCVWT